ncbi:hypothetical protein K458DRAFT_441817 [Lentithecium fluviatile CBS 122367]|uniref:Ricin B lectin domain-containing protein n=1 Tax=Lentithecium fluviatile CBS 122367 TaxID=1168545 RepID=A0A6G1J6V7_9PLEO|nr:hypothetical protein K458DRAFT_441817 [Lentithecium fluviatile CBS 122367]
MANFNTSQWYHLYVNQNKDNAFIGTNLFKDNGTSGSVFYEPTNTTEGRQRWQLYPMNDTYYVLRSKEGGPDAFLGAMFSEDEKTPGQTRARMIRGDLSDDSVYWQISPWGDGTFFLTNKKNGTDWHLGRKLKDGLIAMDSNTTSMPNGQRWSFQDVAAIKTTVFSTVDLPTASATAPSSSGPADSSSSSNSNSGGLSTGAKAAIGASIGGIALIALIVLGLFLLRRRRRSPTPPVEKSVEADSHGTANAAKHELNHDGAVKYEMQDTQYAELPQNARPVELEGDATAAPTGYNGR